MPLGSPFRRLVVSSVSASLAGNSIYLREAYLLSVCCIMGTHHLRATAGFNVITDDCE